MATWEKMLHMESFKLMSLRLEYKGYKGSYYTQKQIKVTYPFFQRIECEHQNFVTVSSAASKSIKSKAVK